MSKAPYFRFYTSDYRDGVRALTFEEQGFYTYLLTLMWDTRGPLPADPKRLAVMMQSDPRQVARLTAALIVKGKLRSDGVTLVNARMMHDIKGSNPETDHQTGDDQTSPEDLPDFSRRSAEDPAKIPQKKPENQAETTSLVTLNSSPLPLPLPLSKPIASSEYVSAPAPASGQTVEIEGLAGGTTAVVSEVARMLNALSPDHRAAHRIVADNCQLYGPEAVKTAYAEMIGDIEDDRHRAPAERKIRRPSARVYVGYIQRAARRAATAAATAAAAKPRPWDTPGVARAADPSARFQSMSPEQAEAALIAQSHAYGAANGRAH